MMASSSATNASLTLRNQKKCNSSSNDLAISARAMDSIVIESARPLVNNELTSDEEIVGPRSDN